MRALADIFDALVATLSDTRLEPDLEDLLWPLTNIFHRMAARVDRELDTNEQAQKRSQREQDGSEVRSVELETLTAEGLSLIERRNAYELMRDLAAEFFEAHLGQAWRPRTGSQVSRRTMTAALIDSRDFLAAKRRAEIEPLLPAGPKIAFAGGLDFNDHRAIWAALDRVHAKHADMVLLHGGSPKGAERIAACWADSAPVPADRLQARLDAARQGSTLQAQRPAPRRPADRARRLPGLRHHRKPRRQGEDDGRAALRLPHPKDMPVVTRDASDASPIPALEHSGAGRSSL